jgi:hypothetical protein
MDNRGLPPEMSNFYCLPGRAGGTPRVLVWRFNTDSRKAHLSAVTRLLISAMVSRA